MARLDWFVEKLLARCRCYRTYRFPFVTFDPAGDASLGMLTKFEQQHLRWYARREYTGRGRIVDLGCWLGSTTIALSRGVRANRGLSAEATSVPPIVAYDIFEWADWMNPTVRRTALEGKYAAGDSFLDEFIRRIEPWNDLIEVRAGDLTADTWSGGPIEFLCVDAMKNWALTNAIVSTFFPSLVPGVSIVLHQDFSHYYTYWIHLLMYRLRDYFAPVFSVACSSSMVFRYVRELPRELTESRISLDSFTRDEIDNAFEYSLRLVPGPGRPEILAARTMALIDLKAFDAAEAAIGELQRLGFGRDIYPTNLVLKRMPRR